MIDPEDCRFTDQAKCPFCGYEDRDSWELPDEGYAWCGSCDEKFFVSRIVSVNYITEKPRKE